MRPTSVIRVPDQVVEAVQAPVVRGAQDLVFHGWDGTGSHFGRYYPSATVTRFSRVVFFVPGPPVGYESEATRSFSIYRNGVLIRTFSLGPSFPQKYVEEDYVLPTPVTSNDYFTAQISLNSVAQLRLG